MLETRSLGLDSLKQAQVSLGSRVRSLMAERGFPSVAAEGFAASSVVVSFTDDPDVKTEAAFQAGRHAGRSGRAADVWRTR